MKLFRRMRAQVCRQMGTNLTMKSQNFTDFLAHFNSQSKNSYTDLLANFDIMIIQKDQWSFNDMDSSMESRRSLVDLKEFLFTNKTLFSIRQINDILNIYRKLKTNSEIRREVDKVFDELSLELEVKLSVLFESLRAERSKTRLY